jgi:hypothetical protein
MSGKEFYTRRQDIAKIVSIPEIFITKIKTCSCGVDLQGYGHLLHIHRVQIQYGWASGVISRFFYSNFGFLSPVRCI